MTILLSNFEALLGLPDFVGYIFIFLLGAIVGSFLNVVIHRIPIEESIIFPNSACPNCKTAIKPYDNIPIFGWLFLGGKCRNCKSPISFRYPAVELLNAMLYLLVFWQIGFTPFLPVALIFISAIVALIFIDAEHMILPDVINFPLLFFALLVRLIFAFAFGYSYFSDMAYYPLNLLTDYPVWLVSLFGAILGGVVGGGSLWLVGEIWKRLRGVDAMGFGDVKMMFAVGALLGWRLTILSIFLGTGAIISLLFGEHLIKWYLAAFVP